MIVVADASPLISLAYLNRLPLLLNLFDSIRIPEAVFREVSKVGKPHSQELEAFCKPFVAHVSNRLAVDLLHETLGIGESEAIVLAVETPNSIVLVDDLKARRVVQRRQLDLIGVVGVLLLAKQRGLIVNLKSQLDILIANDIRIGRKLYNMMLQQVGELG